MSVDPITLIFLALAILVLAGVLVFAAHAYTKINQKLHESEELNRHLQNQLAEKPTKLLETAHEKAQEIIDQANKHANEILASSKAYEDTSNAALKEKLTQLEKDQEAVFASASQEMKTAYQDLLSQIQEQDMNALKSMTKDIQEDVLSDFKEFRETLEKQTINSEKVVKEKIDEEYLAIEKELQDYKRQKYQKIDEDIYKILYRVSEMVLSQGISFDTHKQLVLEALETAKKEQVFK
jgi:F0F1-type ATP synthase membrane subunit b/b'